MTRFSNILINGFRRLSHIDLPLRGLNVTIGANGVGKSSLLDSLDLLAKSASGRLNETLSGHGGLASLLTIDRAEALYFAVQTEAREPMDYSLQLTPSGAGYSISQEGLRLYHEGADSPTSFRWRVESRGGDIRYYHGDSDQLVRPTWEHNPTETSLSQVPKLFQESESFRQRLASTTYYHALDVHSGAPVRLPQGMRPANLPGANGEDLVSCLYSLREASRDRFDAVCDALAAAFPGFDRLDFPPVAAGTLAMTWRDKRFSRPLYMNQLSEGTLRFLWLATLLQSPGLTAVTLIDEPEVSLHPELLSLLAGLMREASERTQLIVATHSDRLIRFLEPTEVVVMDSEEDGLAQLRWADSLDIEKWLEDYTLDELWQKGRLGGRA